MSPVFIIVQAGQQELVPFRYEIKMGNDTHAFTPDTLAEDKLVASVQAAEIGAVHKGQFQNVPKSRLKIVWEVQICTSPPANIQPLKPKVWATSELLLNADTIYSMENLN